MTRYHKLRRSALAATAVAALAVSLAACGRPDANPSAIPDVVLDDDPATGEVTILIPATRPTDATDETIAEFYFSKEWLSENPDLELRFDYIPADQYYTKLLASVVTGTTPDIALMSLSAQAPVVASGALAPIPTGLDTSAFLPNVLELGTYDDVTYTVPVNTSARVLIYRKDLAEKAGVEAPATWDDFVPFLESLKESGVEQPWMGDIGWDSFSGSAWSSLLLSAGGSMLDESGEQWNLDTAEAIAATEFYAAPFEAQVSSPDGPTFLEQASSFISGKVGAVVSGTFFLNQLAAAGADQEWIAEHVGTAVVPAGEAGSVAQLDGGGYAVFSASQNPVSAWKVVRELSSKESQLRNFAGANQLPSRSDVWDDPALASSTLLAAFREQTETAKVLPVVPNMTQVQTIIGKELETVVRGTSTAAAAMARIQSQAEAIGVGR